MSIFANRTKPDDFYEEVFARIYYAVIADFEFGSSTRDSRGNIINKSTQFFDEGKDYPGEFIFDLYTKISFELSNNPSISIDKFKAYNDRIYFGWIYDQEPEYAKSYLSLFELLYVDEPEENESSPSEENTFDPPVYIIRDINRPDGQGPRGRIIFEINKESLGFENQEVLLGRGEIDDDTVNIQSSRFENGRPVINIMKFVDVILTTEDFNPLSLGEQIVKKLQQQLTDFNSSNPTGGTGEIKEDQANFIIVSGRDPKSPPENIYEYTFKGQVQSDSNNKELSQVLISDNLNTQGLLGSSVLSNRYGYFTLKGEYIAQASDSTEIYDSIEYVVKEGDTLSIISKKYPQKGASGNDIPFYPDRSMQIYKANPKLEGRSISLDNSANESQVLENTNLILAGESIKIPFFNYEVSIQTFNITFEKEGYVSKVLIPFSSNKSILPYQKILLKSKETSKKETIKQVPVTSAQIKQITLNSQQLDPMGAFTAQTLQELLKQLKMTLIPFILSLLAKFGINNVDEALKKGLGNVSLQCPATLEELNSIISAKNKLTNALNNMYNKLDSIKTGVEFADKIITVANVVFASLSSLVLAFPSIPFAPDVTKLFSTKLPGVNKSTQEVIALTLTLLKTLSSATLVVLNLFLQSLQKALNYNALLDQAISDCALNFTDGPNTNNENRDGGVGILTQVKLTEELQNATVEQLLNNNPVVPEANGFTFDVIAVDGVEVSGLKRRRAVAKNDQDVIMLQGEPSFSSNDQILIDELIYYIKQNNLSPDGTGVGIN